MKRVLTILAILLLPLSVWAMTPVADSDLSNVTGQAGVNINADLTMNVSIGTMAWGDNDGISGTYMPWETNAVGGYIGITGFALNNLQVKARVSDSYNSYSTLLLKPITIDVATAATGGYSVSNYDGSTHTIQAGTTFVRIGLGALKVSFDELQFDVSLGTHAASGYIGTAPTLNQTIGTVTIGGVAVYINPWSYVDIYNSHTSPTTTQGVTFAFNIILDHVTVPYMSWGDGDGLASASTGSTGAPAGFKWISSNNSAGYIGLNNFQLGNNNEAGVVITGTVAIDILTDNGTGVYSGLPKLMDYLKPIMRSSGFDPASYASVCAFIAAAGTPAGTPIGYLLANYGQVPTPYTMVHISFPENLSVTVKSMWADVVLSDQAHLGHQNGVTGWTDTTVADQLGDIYIQGLNFSISAGSWVDIWAQ